MRAGVAELSGSCRGWPARAAPPQWVSQQVMVDAAPCCPILTVSVSCHFLLLPNPSANFSWLNLPGNPSGAESSEKQLQLNSVTQNLTSPAGKCALPCNFRTGFSASLRFPVLLTLPLPHPTLLTLSQVSVEDLHCSRHYIRFRG